MDEVLRIALLNAAVAAVMALPVAALSRLAGRAPLTRALWMLVLLKLLTPPLWSVQLWHEAARVHAVAVVTEVPPPVDVPEMTSTSDPVDDGAADESLPLPPPAPVVQPAPMTAPAATPPSTAPAFSWTWLIVVAWGLGCAIYTMAIVLAAARLRWLIRRSSPAAESVQSQVNHLARRMGLRKPPMVAFVRGTISPMLCAIVGFPRILLPLNLWEKLSEEQRETVLAHELAHLRRRDHWMTVLELVVSVLYWWHPVVWWARRELREATEQCCDAWVVWSMPRRASSYAAALIEAVEFISTARPGAPALASRMGQFADLKRRLVMIKQGNVRRALSRPAVVVICGAAGLLLPLAPSFGDDAKPVTAAVPSVAPVAAGPTEVAVARPRVVANVAPTAAVAVDVAVSDDPDDNADDRGKADKDRNQAEEQAKADKDRAQAEKQRAQAERRAADAQKRMAERYDQEIQRAHRDLERAQQQLQHAAQRVAELESRRGEMMSRLSKDMGTFGGGGTAAPQASPEMGNSANRIRNFGRSGSARSQSSGDVERRLDMMEQQMRQMMDQLRQMRRQMRSGSSSESAPDAPSAK
ncbi:MAG TPA: M56 family metallopeptidase [Tepidisphaeraceae bacterium]|nr:M56 family metallopeptidase [Tepidisphaeraceae bacterium]